MRVIDWGFPRFPDLHADSAPNGVAEVLEQRGVLLAVSVHGRLQRGGGLQDRVRLAENVKRRRKGKRPRERWLGGGRMGDGVKRVTRG